MNAAVRAALAQMSGEKFPLNTPPNSGEVFVARLAAYEEAVQHTLQKMAALLGTWATPEQLPKLMTMVARIDENGTGVDGVRLYSLSLLLYRNRLTRRRERPFALRGNGSPLDRQGEAHRNYPAVLRN